MFRHLEALTGRHGVYEHARFDQPRRAHGYTTDDNARVLVVLAPRPGEWDSEAFRLALDFVVAGRVHGGWHNRMSHWGTWTDDLGSDDCHGRALWGLGTAIACGVEHPSLSDVFTAGLDFRSSSPRAVAYAALGAVRARPYLPAEVGAFLDRISTRFAEPRRGDWIWPEPRLTYANARIPQAMIEVGAVTGVDDLREHGLDLLDWLMKLELRGTHFSFTPVDGRGPGEVGPGFDQQPIEAWAMSDACRTAWDVDGSARWKRAIELTGRWFLGLNDNGSRLYDVSTGAGFDGLHPVGVNRNCGSESTLSALAALAGWHQLG